MERERGTSVNGQEPTFTPEQLEGADARAKAMNAEIEQAFRELPPEELLALTGKLSHHEEGQIRMDRAFGVETQECES